MTNLASRRDLLAGITAAACSTPAGAIPSRSADPIFSAIKAHREAWSAFIAANAEYQAVEKREWDGMLSPDDSRLASATDRECRCMYAVNEAARALTTTSITTLAGAAALSRYVYEFSAQGNALTIGDAGWIELHGHLAHVLENQIANDFA